MHASTGQVSETGRGRKEADRMECILHRDEVEKSTVLEILSVAYGEDGSMEHTTEGSGIVPGDKNVL